MKLKKALKIFENNMDIDIYSITNNRVPIVSGTPVTIREFYESLLTKKVKHIHFNVRGYKMIIFIDNED